MFQRTLADDVTDCFTLAKEFNGRPEKALLLRLSSEFQALANPLAAGHVGDVPCFAQRASQEITAAVKAKHPNARLAHLKMAQRYEALTHDRQVQGSSYG